jgi:hypothetical protein
VVPDGTSSQTTIKDRPLKNPARRCRGVQMVLIGVLSASHRKADHVLPGGEAGCHFSAVDIGSQPVAAGTEVR